jgi:D-glucosaminate-6-phosphate ammonia-lyase
VTRSVLADLGVRPMINAAGPLTRLGGGPLGPEVRAAMLEAASSSISIEDLQKSAGRVIAEVTGAEAGYVTAGSAAGLTLSAAACIARLDPARMDRLPDTETMPNEIVVQRAHQVAYNHALRAAGARLIEVGYIGYPGVGATYPWQVEAAITDRTVALFFQLVDAPNTVGLEGFVAIAHARGLPVIVDAAAALPPPENLSRFIAAGVDLVSFSGGKAIGGPQASGILCGRADLIESVALQHQDLDVPPALWSVRGHVAPLPHHGIGRSMKVGKEEIVGLVAALRAYVVRDHAAERERWCAQLERIAAALRDDTSVKVDRHDNTRGVSLLRIDVGSAERAMDVFLALEQGDPSVAVGHGALADGALVLNPLVLQLGEEDIVAQRLLSALEARTR